MGCVRTDLALEMAEGIEDHEIFEGVCVRESYDAKRELRITRVLITSEAGSKKLEKPMGTYVTLESPHLGEADKDIHEEIIQGLVALFSEMVADIEQKKVLVVGIGNRSISPDALGPMVVDHLFITRHLFEQYSEEEAVVKGMGNVSAIAPGVMAQTGMETVEILKGVIAQTSPDVVIAVDALAARSMKRLNQTIQISDTGIQPGSGVSNYRFALTKETLGIPVIGLGIPTVIDAATLVSDAMDTLVGVLKDHYPYKIIEEAINGFDKQDQYRLMKELIEPQLMNMFVTPKDVDLHVNQMSYTVSEAINRWCHHQL